MTESAPALIIDKTPTCIAQAHSPQVVDFLHNENIIKKIEALLRAFSTQYSDLQEAEEPLNRKALTQLAEGDSPALPENITAAQVQAFLRWMKNEVILLIHHDDKTKESVPVGQRAQHPLVLLAQEAPNSVHTNRLLAKIQDILRKISAATGSQHKRVTYPQVQSVDLMRYEPATILRLVREAPDTCLSHLRGIGPERRMALLNHLYPYISGVDPQLTLTRNWKHFGVKSGLFTKHLATNISHLWEFLTAAASAAERSESTAVNV